MQRHSPSTEVPPYTFPSYTEAYLNLNPTETAQAQLVVDLTDNEAPIRSFQKLMEANGDLFTRDHSRRVAMAAVAIGSRLGLADAELILLAEGAQSHDIGKLDPEIQVVVKSSVQFELGSIERKTAMAIIERHPYHSADLIACTSWPDDHKRRVASIVGAHHLYSSRESYGLQPDSDVAHLAEIVAAADMLDAFASERPYKPAYGRNEIADLLQTQFTGDPKIIEATSQPRSAKQMLASTAISH